MRRNILFIVNPISGGNRFINIMTRILERIVKKCDCDYDIRLTEYPGHATEMAQLAEQEGFDIVAAVGGDGTVNEVATGLVNTSISLGIIPRGSGDGLARGLNLPLLLRPAIRAVCLGPPCQIDVGRIEDRYFFATSGMGFDAVVGKLFSEGNIRGPLPYFYISVREFINYKPQEFILQFNNQELKVKALILAVANTNQFGNGAMIAPMAKPDDGLLDVCIIKDIGILQAFRHLPKLFTGKLIKTSYYEFYHTSRIKIIRPELAPIHVDGEPIDGNKELHISILPKALSVILPSNKY